MNGLALYCAKLEVPKHKLQNKKIQMENIELQYKNDGFIPDLETVNTSFEIIDIGLELLKVGMGIGMNLNLISNQIFQFQMQLQNIILKMQNLIQNQNMGMNPIMNNNAFFNNGLGNVMNSDNKIKINVRFKTILGHSTIIVSNYETPINEVIENYLNKFNIPNEKRKSIRFLLNGCVVRENDRTSIGDFCDKGLNSLLIIVHEANNIIG